MLHKLVIKIKHIICTADIQHILKNFIHSFIQKIPHKYQGPRNIDVKAKQLASPLLPGPETLPMTWQSPQAPGQRWTDPMNTLWF